MKKLYLSVSFLLVFCAVYGKTVDVEPIPLNAGEAIVLDSESSYMLWDVTAAKGDKQRLYHSGFYLYGNKSKKAACTAKIKFKDLDCSGFDQLVATMNCRGNEPVKIVIKAYTDKGVKIAVCKESKNGIWANFDMIIKLDGAKKISAVVMECEKINANITGLFVTTPLLFLRNSKEFSAWIKHWDRFSKLKWKGLIKGEGYQPKYKPLYGLLFNQQALELYRRNNTSFINSRVKKYQNAPMPEPAISPRSQRGMAIRGYVNERYKRAGTFLNRMGTKVAFIGLAAKNKDLMRLGARYTLSIASVGEWSEDPAAHTMAYGVPMATFSAGYYGFVCALMLDYCGEMLTPRGRSYVLKMLCFKAVAPVSFSMWSRSQCNFGSNQGAIFLKAKIASLLMTERTFPYVSDYSTLALKELNIVMDNEFKKDGSFMESVGYLDTTMENAIVSYAMYSSMRNKPLADFIPENIKKSGLYAQVINSTNKNPKRKVISIGRGYSWDIANRTVQTVMFMAAANPHSMWVNLYKKIKPSLLRACTVTDYHGFGPMNYRLMSMAEKGRTVVPKAFVELPGCGLAASLREHDGEKVKIVAIGSAMGVGKRLEDAGSFVLEYAGDTFAMYIPCHGGIFETSKYKNSLNVITRDNEMRYPLLKDTWKDYTNADMNFLRPEASGNEQKFTAKTDLTKRCESAFMKNWTRTIDSPGPDVVKITDSYKLGRFSKAAAVTWVTYLPAEIKGNKVVITGLYGGIAEIMIPAGCTAKIEKFIPHGGIRSDLSSNKGMNLAPDYQSTRIIISKSSKPDQQDSIVLVCNLKKV